MSVTCVFGMQWGATREGQGRRPPRRRERRRRPLPGRGERRPHGHRRGGEVAPLHSPSGVLHPKSVNVIANGVVVDPWTLFEEIDELATGRVARGAPARLRPRPRCRPTTSSWTAPSRRCAATPRSAPRAGHRPGLRGQVHARRAPGSATSCGPTTSAWARNLAARNEIREGGARAARSAAGPRRRDGDRRAARPVGRRHYRRHHEAWRAGRRVLLEGGQGFGST